MCYEFTLGMAQSAEACLDHWRSNRSQPNSREFHMPRYNAQMWMCEWFPASSALWADGIRMDDGRG